MTDSSHAHYTAELKERRPEIAEFIACCGRGGPTPQDIIAMRHCLRRLSELSSTHGSAQIHQLAETLDHALEHPHTADRISVHSLSTVLLSLCHQALITTQGGAVQAFAPPQSFAHATVLCIDDDRIIRATLGTMFGDHVRILTAADGAEGLAMIRRHRPDLVLLDDTMPQLSGMKVMEAMGADAMLSCIAVIMLTSSDRPQDIARAMHAGAADYVIKPFDPHVLAKKVYAQLARSKA